MEKGTKFKRINIDDEFPLNFIKFLNDDRGLEAPIEMTEDIRNAVIYLISKLQPREQQVIKLRFVERKTFSEIGKIITVTQERVRQILNHVGREIRTPWNWKYIQYGMEGYVRHIAKSEYERGYQEGYEMAKLEIENGIESVRRTSILDEPIETLNLSIRSKNGMVRKNCSLIKDVVNLTAEEIDGIRNFGIKSAIETANKLKAVGITGTAWDKFL